LNSERVSLIRLGRGLICMHAMPNKTRERINLYGDGGDWVSG